MAKYKALMGLALKGLNKKTGNQYRVNDKNTENTKHTVKQYWQVQ